MAVSVKLDDQMKSRVQHLAASRERTAHWIMRKAISEYVEREEARDHFTQEALSSWDAYQQEGQHITGAEVQEWLSRWGTEDAKKSPECHD